MTAWSQARHADVVAEMARRAQQASTPKRAPTGVATSTATRIALWLTRSPLSWPFPRGPVLVACLLHLEMQAHPAVAEAMRHGQVDRGKAEEICAHLERLESPTFAEILERAALDYAETHTRSQLRAWLSKRVIAAEPLLAEQRRERAKQQRRVRYFAGDDGMATLLADLPAEDALAIYRVIDQTAHASCADEAFAATTLRRMPFRGLGPTGRPGSHPDGRTMDQRRADAFTDLVLGPMLGQAQPRRRCCPRWRRPLRECIVDAETLAGVQEQARGAGWLRRHHCRACARTRRWRCPVAATPDRSDRQSPRGLAAALSTRPSAYASSSSTETSPVDSRVVVVQPASSERSRPHRSFPRWCTPWRRTWRRCVVPTTFSRPILSGRSSKTSDGSLTWTTPSGRVFRTYPHDYRSGAPPGMSHPN